MEATADRCKKLQGTCNTLEDALQAKKLEVEALKGEFVKATQQANTYGARVQELTQAHQGQVRIAALPPCPGCELTMAAPPRALDVWHSMQHDKRWRSGCTRQSRRCTPPMTN